MKAQWTVEDIMAFHPCYSEGKVRELFGDKKFATASDICKANIPPQDLLWLVLRPDFIPEKQLHEIAIWCAEKIAIPIWEKYYQDDKRPQKAIKVKKAWLKGKATIEELAVAGAVAWDAARAVAGAFAWDAARAAAWAAARAAAWAAARAAAWDAAEAVGAAGKAKIKKHIIKVMLKK